MIYHVSGALGNVDRDSTILRTPNWRWLNVGVTLLVYLYRNCGVVSNCFGILQRSLFKTTLRYQRHGVKGLCCGPAGHVGAC